MADLKIYHFDPRTGELLGQGFADADPLDKGNWLIPAHATEVAPPQAKADKARVFDGRDWVYVDIVDKTGETMPRDPLPGGADAASQINAVAAQFTPLRLLDAIASGDWSFAADLNKQISELRAQLPKEMSK